MSSADMRVSSSRELALVIQPEDGKAEKALAKFLELLLGYRYGLRVESLTAVAEISRILRDRSEQVHSVYLVQRQPVSVKSTVPILSVRGTVPLFLILPGHVAQEQQEACTGVGNVYVCTWEMAFAGGEGSLPQIVASGLTDEEETSDATDALLEERVKNRLAHMNTLPTLPTIIAEIRRLVDDPDATMDQLEVVVAADPAIALKVMQTANSPLFAGTGRKDKPSLQEALVRLGLRKVGAIAQQIAVVNTFVSSEASGFDLQRFWEHSIACAVIADRLCEGDFVTLEEEIPFNDYWMAALLHDCGKVVLGFFFWEWFERILRLMDSDDCSFHEAEIEIMGAMAGHDLIGELLLQKAQMPTELIEAVGLHHMPGDAPSSLVALIHVANGLSKEIGLSYIEGESVSYEPSALKALNLTAENLVGLKEMLSEAAVSEVKELVKQCLQG